MELFSARLVSISDETPTVKRLEFEIQESGFTYKPGQWIDFYARIEGIQTVAGFSLTSSPFNNSGRIELAVKRSPHPVSAYLHGQAQIGETYQISNGMGPVFYDRQIGDEIVLIAGGIGVTPLISMFRTVRDHWQEVKATLIYSDNDPQEFAYGQELRNSVSQHQNLDVHFTLTGDHESAPEWITHRGRIDQAWLQALKAPELAHYFLCGPQPMLAALGQELSALGVPRVCIHYEEW